MLDFVFLYLMICLLSLVLLLTPSNAWFRSLHEYLSPNTIQSSKYLLYRREEYVENKKKNSHLVSNYILFVCIYSLF